MTLLPPKAPRAPLERRSGLLFSWRADPLALAALTGQLPSFSRAGTGAAVDAAGRVYYAIDALPRWRYTGGRPGLLLEPAATNLLAYSDNLGQWTNVSTTVTGSQADPSGGTTARLVVPDLGGSSSALYRTIGSGVGDVTFSIHVLPLTQNFSFGIYDATAGQWKLLVGFTGYTSYAAPPVLAVRNGSGTLHPVDVLGGNWFRLAATVTGLNTSNTHHFYIYPGGDTATAGAGNRVWRAQAESGYVPTAPILTAGTTDNRPTDALTFPVGFAPGPLTVYASFVERGLRYQGAGTTSLLYLGSTSGAGPVVGLFNPSQTYGARHHNGSAEVTSGGALSAPTLGQVVELCAQVYDDGSVQAHQSIAGGAVASGSRSAALGFAAAWSAASLSFAHLRAEWRALRIAAGVRTMDEMRQAF